MIYFSRPELDAIKSMAQVRHDVLAKSIIQKIDQEKQRVSHVKVGHMPLLSASDERIQMNYDSETNDLQIS